MRRLISGAALALAATVALSTGAVAYNSQPPAVLAEPYIATDDNTLHDIAIVFDLGFVELVAANPGVDPWKPGDGTSVRLPTRHLLPDGLRQGLIVNIGDQRVYLFKEDGEVESFPIGIGREGWSIPMGQTRITRKREHPTWTPPKSIREEKPDLPAVVEAGPDNPLGDYALNLGFPSYLLHGTNKPDGVGRRVSHGCIRLYPWDIEHVFQMVKVGTPVQIVNQPIKLETVDGELYLEVHPEDSQIDEIEATGRFTPRSIPDLETFVTEKAGVEAGRIDWRMVTQAADQRTGLPVRITGSFDVVEQPVSGLSDPETRRTARQMPRERAVERPSRRDVAPVERGPDFQERGGPVSLTRRPEAPRGLETARDSAREKESPGAGIW